MRSAAAVLICALAIVGSFAGCSRQDDPAAAVKSFVDLLAAGKAGEAYDQGSFLFREQQTRLFFETSVRQFEMDKITGVQLGSVEYRDERQVARVPVEFEIEGGKKIALVAAVTQEDGAWRVLSLKTPRDRAGVVRNPFTLIGRSTGFFDPTAQHAPPGDANAKALAHRSLLSFNRATQQQSFLQFFDECAVRWQEQLARPDAPPVMPGRRREPLTPKERELGAGRLQSAFQAFIEQKIDISGIDGVEPVLDRPAWVNTEGLLVISGYYPTKPYRVLFSLRYWYELPDWRLFGLDVKFTSAAPKS